MVRGTNTIFIINEGEIQKDLVNELQNNDFKVLTANEDNEVMRVLNIKKPQLIIMEILSQEFGQRMLNLIKKDEEFRIIPIIIISQVENIEKEVKMFEMGVNDYIHKPYEYKELVARIRAHLKLYLICLEMINQNEILRQTAVFDENTGLYNKKYLMGRIIGEVSRAVREGVALSFVIIEIDDAENVISMYGEDAKNFLLKQITFMLRQVVRLSDIVIRYGDNQLAVLCPITDRSGLDTFVERLRMMIERNVFDYKDTKIRTTVSIGAYTLGSADFNSFEKKLNNMFVYAEEALERAKSKDGNRVEFFD